MSQFSDQKPIYATAYAVNDPASSAPSAPVFVPSSSPAQPDTDRTQILTQNYSSTFPRGILGQINASCSQFSTRHWIVDNSGSMATCDGHVLLNNKSISCSRWEELASSITWHAELAAATNTPTTYHLLNHPGMGAQQTVTVSTTGDLPNIQKTMSTSPTGMTPLCAQIRAVYQDIASQAASLRQAGKKALLVIASDGAASDGDVAAALRPFRELPCWIVIRLCTDDDTVVDYWNSIDDELELDMDVLDDIVGEAKEVCAENPWLTYGVPLHRLREFGTSAKEVRRGRGSERVRYMRARYMFAIYAIVYSLICHRLFTYIRGAPRSASNTLFSLICWTSAGSTARRRGRSST